MSFLAAYKDEYESTPDMTINDLCEKYSLNSNDLPGHKHWSKNDGSEEPEQTLVPASHMPDNTIFNPPSPLPTSEIEKTNQEKIESFKTKAIDHALTFIEDTKFIEVKEFKDVVSVISDIEKSYQKSGPEGNTINILVQNIMKEVQDDC